MVKEKKAEYDRCKGEHWCTSQGFLKRKNQGREKWLYTLSNTCKAGACIYYPTKPEATPTHLVPAIATAEDLRRRHARGLMPPTNDLTAYEVECYMTAGDAQDAVDNDDDEATEAKPPELPPETEHSAFRHWFDDDTSDK